MYYHVEGELLQYEDIDRIICNDSNHINSKNVHMLLLCINELNVKNIYKKASENNARSLESRASAKGKAVLAVPWPDHSDVPGQN